MEVGEAEVAESPADQSIEVLAPGARHGRCTCALSAWFVMPHVATESCH